MRTIEVWGSAYNSHRDQVVAEMERCLSAMLAQPAPSELYAPFLRGSKAHLVFESESRETAEECKDKFNQMVASRVGAD